MKQAVDRSVWQGRVDALEGELGARWQTADQAALQAGQEFGAVHCSAPR